MVKIEIPVLSKEQKSDMYTWLNDFASSEIDGNCHAYHATVEINRLMLKCGEIEVAREIRVKRKELTSEISGEISKSMVNFLDNYDTINGDKVKIND
ncbi:MAG: hypothetical protein BMS9Abin31_0146 [Gammaproteobacteria bacterium]|nr:MAG: hypothetical protein BMS9Abin31_0146 [Gammaproteobacteria bacterium]